MNTKSKKPVTKLEKVSINRIALCSNPADQDANFVLVKAEDNVEEVDQESANLQTLGPEILKAVEEAVAAAIAKASNPPMVTTMTGDVVEKQPKSDDGGAEAIKDEIKNLVKACNESRTTPKAIKEKVSAVAKFHGVEGPVVEDDGTSEKFAEAITAMNTVTSTLQQMVTHVASMAAPKPAAAAPAKKSDEDPEEEPAVEPVSQEPVTPAPEPVSEEVLKEHLETQKQTRDLVNTLRKLMGKEPVK